VQAELPTADWSLPLTLDVAGGVARTLELGASGLAKVVYDAMDIPQPPLPSVEGAVELYAHVDGRARRLTRSTVPVDRDGAEWSVTANLPESSTMRWVSPELPQGYRIVLEVDGRRLDVARQEQLRLSAGRHRLVVHVAWTPPAATRALPNYPNPFNPETWIPFELKEASDVRIRLYDMGGKVVCRFDLGYRPEGYYTTRAEAAY
jgi:hypothetical protein